MLAATRVLVSFSTMIFTFLINKLVSLSNLSAFHRKFLNPIIEWSRSQSQSQSRNIFLEIIEYGTQTQDCQVFLHKLTCYNLSWRSHCSSLFVFE